jgi:cellulose synthase/poly-beta-1,6-N-acetylglucosamine synthase-like glycosyltransferase
MNKELTIVIPCKNEGRDIIKVLNLISLQKIDCQIIIADSSDRKEDIAYLYHHVSRSPQLVTLVKGGLPSIARNNGAKLVKTPYVLFLDADIYLLKPGLLSHCLSDMKSKDYSLMTCHIRTLTDEYNWVYKIFSIVQILLSKVHPIAIGGFMLFKTETFNQLGGFNEEDKLAEDYHLSSKVKPDKFKIASYNVYTTDRRFKKKGVWYMIKIALQSFLNRNNPEFFKDDHNYWK